MTMVTALGLITRPGLLLAIRTLIHNNRCLLILLIRDCKSFTLGVTACYTYKAESEQLRIFSDL
jgi:hypothetical protein